MLILDITERAWKTSGENQEGIQAVLKDPDLDVESNEAERNLHRRASTLGRVREFLSLMRISVAKVHAQSEREVGNDTPDDVIGNISSTLASDLRMRVSRRTLSRLISKS